jgi:hypothetical protein
VRKNKFCFPPSLALPPQRLAGLSENNPVLRKIEAGERPHKIQRKKWTGALLKVATPGNGSGSSVPRKTLLATTPSRNSSAHELSRSSTGVDMQ